MIVHFNIALVSSRDFQRSSCSISLLLLFRIRHLSVLHNESEVIGNSLARPCSWPESSVTCIASLTDFCCVAEWFTWSEYKYNPPSYISDTCFFHRLYPYIELEYRSGRRCRWTLDLGYSKNRLAFANCIRCTRSTALSSSLWAVGCICMKPLKKSTETVRITARVRDSFAR